MTDRLPAVPVAIRDLSEGNFAKQEGVLPSIIHTKFGDVSRVVLIGVIVDLFSENEALLDDGSGSLEIRSYGRPIRVSVGDTALVIGMVREGPWVSAEIVRHIAPGWIKVHKNSLANRKSTQLVSRPIVIKQEKHISPNDLVLQSIREMDRGDGVDIEELSVQVNLPDFDGVLDALLKEGEIYEIRGKVKVLK